MTKSDNISLTVFTINYKIETISVLETILLYVVFDFYI